MNSNLDMVQNAIPYITLL